MNEDQIKGSVEKAVVIAMKYGAPKEEAFCLALFQLACGTCRKYHMREGTCRGIWDNQHLADHDHFQCREFDRIEK